MIEWIFAIALLVSITCSLSGVFLVLRRDSLLGDSISHSILLGIALVFLVFKTRDPILMTIGGVISGVLTALISKYLSLRLPTDTALGIVFSSLFALGVIIISFSARKVDLDPTCVLYGNLELLPFDTINGVPRAFVNALVLFLLVVLFLLLFWRVLLVASFDEVLSKALGINPRVVYYVFVCLISIVTVLFFEMVGSILVIGMLVTPVATALLVTSKLSGVFIFSVVFSIVASVFGFSLSLVLDAPAASGIATAGLLIFLLVLFLWPKTGLLAKFLERMFTRYRIAKEDMLADLYRRSEKGVNVFSKTLISRALLPYLKLSKLIEGDSTSGFSLTEEGREIGKSIIRKHRLFEAFLEQEVGLPSDHLHEISEKVEHFISDSSENKLRETVKSKRDPHGKIIP
jgi:ABC-type Mn2+/Zn2+ transport system permease subunit/Mn-dependent DtxR family transcriptional regulator